MVQRANSSNALDLFRAGTRIVRLTWAHHSSRDEVAADYRASLNHPRERSGNGLTLDQTTNP
jgi:hypothetical protein